MQTILEPELLASTSMQELMREMLVRLGENPERDGLRDTPARMERSMQYLTKGYQENPEEILLGAAVRAGIGKVGWHTPSVTPTQQRCAVPAPISRCSRSCCDMPTSRPR